MVDFNLPSNLSLDEVIEAIHNTNGHGWCLSCGTIATGVESDARKYQCAACGESMVYGAEEILTMFS